MGTLEVHEHCIVSGPRSNVCGRNKFTHSHEGGNVPHEHPCTGPSSYTIDKDAWYERTGLRGGGRKKFTKKPTGEQFPIVSIDPTDLEFDVIYCVGAMEKFREWDPKSTGGGDAAMHRVALGFGMKPVLKVLP